MLICVDNIDSHSLEQLLSLYAESMADLSGNYASTEEMHTAYARFLQEFISDPTQLILIEEDNNTWVSGLRAIETKSGCWFLEAVETKPEERKKGFGQSLLLHTIEYLQTLGMTEISCQIAKTNFKSQKLHEKCGFLPTSAPALDPWGQLDDKTILYRFSRTMQL